MGCKKTLFDFVAIVFVISYATIGHAGTLNRATGIWLFENEEKLLDATSGENLTVFGTFEVVPGPGGKPAVRIGKGSYLRCSHGIAPNGGGNKVNQYSILLDLRCSMEDRFYALLQTDLENKQDNIFEIMNKERAIGSSFVGRSRVDSIEPKAWQRLVVVVDNTNGKMEGYVNGEKVLRGFGQPIDGRYSLEEALLLFADDDGEDNTIDIARIAVFPYAITQHDVTSLQLDLPLCAGDEPPLIAGTIQGPREASVGEPVTFRFQVNAGQSTLAQFRVDWDNNEIDRWTILADASMPVRTKHTFSLPGEKTLQIKLRNECGNTSDWLPFAKITINGDPSVKCLTKAYQQNLREDGITVIWESNVKLPGKLLYGPKENPFENRGQAVVFPTGSGTFIYKVIVNGLNPATEYSYKAVLEPEYDMGSGVFCTAPIEFKPFSFCVWSDSQGHNKGAYEKDPLEPTKSMMKSMAASGIQFAVTTGDLAEDGHNYFDVRRFFLDRVATYLGTQVPFFIAWGNHDSYEGATIRFFADLPSKHRPEFGPGYGSYAFTYAECRFICIDHASMFPDITGWLDSELQSEASQKARHRFLFIHIPPYCELWIDGHGELRQKLVPLMEKYKVEACFSGHTHNYERGFKNGVHYVITGGGSWLDHGEKVVAEWPHFKVGGKNPLGQFPNGLVNQYMRIHVDESGWRAECVAFNPDGSEIGVLDTFSSSENPN